MKIKIKAKGKRRASKKPASKKNTRYV